MTARTIESSAAFGMGGILFSSGLFAFARKGSKSSLLIASLCAVPYVYAGNLIQTGKAGSGHSLGVATAGLLATGMTVRMLATWKLVPAGPVVLLALASGAFHLECMKYRVRYEIEKEREQGQAPPPAELVLVMTLASVAHHLGKLGM